MTLLLETSCSAWDLGRAIRTLLGAKVKRIATSLIRTRESTK